MKKVFVIENLFCSNMKQLIFFVLLFPSLLFAEGENKFLSKAVFEENKGQVKCDTINTRGGLNPQIQFILRGKERTYFFSDRGYSIVENSNEKKGSRIDFFFENGKTCMPEGIEKTAAKNSYYTASGNFPVTCFRRIIYHNAFTGADLEFSVTGDYIKKSVNIHGPGFPERITFDLSGADAWPIHDRGYSFGEISTGFSEILVRQPDRFHAELQRGISTDFPFSNPTYSLRTNCGNEQIALTSSIEWLTYIGGTNSDEIFGITLTNDSGVVITGRTASADFPSTPGSYQDTFATNYDAVVTRFDKAGNCLWSTFYGGTNFDGAYQLIALDSSFVIAGMTNSTDLPMFNATQATQGGSYDAFLLLLNDSGQLVRSTYYGGTASDLGLSIAKGVNGEIVLAGSSSSTDLPFAGSGFQGTMAGMIDAFVAVFDNAFNVQWSTYYGGSFVEDIHAVTVTPQNEIAFTGATRSFNFPVTPDAWQNGLMNQPDNYVVKFSMAGARLYATFFGGTNTEDANGIVGDENGNLYITGFTYSADFPTQGTIFQPTILGQNDVYVSRFDSTGQLVWSTFVGGGGQDVAWGMYRFGKYIFICGQTESPSFPVSANAIQSAYAANGDGFVIKMDTSGQMISGTFMGGNGVDALLAMVVDADTSVFACGNSYSTNLPTGSNPFQATNAGAGDGYVVKFGMSEELISTDVITVTENNSLLVYPDPATDFITIELLSNNLITEIEILDATGRVAVKQDKVQQNKISIYVSDLNAGIYLVKVVDDHSQLQTIRIAIK
ncbi:SBBP repeat-containing protein [soil metagenome]